MQTIAGLAQNTESSRSDIASDQPDQRCGVTWNVNAQPASIRPKPLACPRMDLPIASYLCSIERDPEFAVDCRSLKPLDHGPLETTGGLGKRYVDVAGIFVENGHQVGRAALARGIGRKVGALRLSCRPMQRAPDKLLGHHQPVELWPHHEAASDRTHDRRIEPVRTTVQVDSHATHGCELQAKVSGP